MAVHELLIDGLAISFEDRGVGPPCVVLHGFTGSAAAMGPLVDGLAGFRLVIPDLVGHGSSTAPDDVGYYTMEALVTQVDSLIDRCGLEQVAIVGYSFGARIGLSYAVARPERVRHLVTIGGTAGIADPAEAGARRAADEGLAQLIEEEGVPAFVDRWEQAPIFASQHRLPDPVRVAIRRGRLANRTVGLANSLRGAGTGAMPPLWDALPALTVATTVVAGELDEKFVDIAARMVEKLPHASLRIVPGAGHAAHLEAPEACRSVVRAALGGEAGIGA